jgi:protein-tyrosine phosphatase
LAFLFNFLIKNQFSNSSVDVPAVANFNHINNKPVIPDIENNPVIADPEPEIFRADKPDYMRIRPYPDPFKSRYYSNLDFFFKLFNLV